jgi:hypothetical protein
MDSVESATLFAAGRAAVSLSVSTSHALLSVIMTSIISRLPCCFGWVLRYYSQHVIMAVNEHNLSAIYGTMKSVEVLLSRIPLDIEDEGDVQKSATVAILRGFRAINSAVPDYQDLSDVYKVARDSIKHCPRAAAEVMIDWMNQQANLETFPSHNMHIKVQQLIFDISLELLWRWRVKQLPDLEESFSQLQVAWQFVRVSSPPRDVDKYFGVCFAMVVEFLMMEEYVCVACITNFLVLLRRVCGTDPKNAMLTRVLAQADAKRVGMHTVAELNTFWCA